MKTYVEKLNSETFSVHHNPSITEHRRFQVRLIGKTGRLEDIQDDTKTNDIVGYGKSLERAAKEAWQKKHDAD